MSFKGRNDRQFNEFFGEGSRSTPPREGYSVSEDVFSLAGKQPQGKKTSRFHSHSEGYPSRQTAVPVQAAVKESRSEAVRRRFEPGYNGQSGRRNNGRFHRHDGMAEMNPPRAARHDRRDAPDGAMCAYPAPYPGYPEGPEENNGRTGRGKGKKAVLITLGVIFAMLLLAVAVFMLRPQDGGLHFRVYGSLPQVENLRQTQAYTHGGWLDWEPVDSVAGYRIYRRSETTGEFVPVNTAYMSWTYVSGLDHGSRAEYLIRPFCKTEQGDYIEQNGAQIVVKTRSQDAKDISHQTATARSITLEWQPVDGADGYEIQQHTGWFRYEPCAESTEAQAEVSGLQASTEYTFRMRPYVEIDTGRRYGDWSEKISSATSPETVKNLAQGETTDSGYLLSWTVDSAVTGFELYRADAQTGQPTELMGQCGVNRYEIAGLESVNISSYCVRGFLRHSSGISYGEFSDVLTAVTLPSQVKGVDQYTAADGGYRIFWEAAERAEGYEIYAYSCHRDEYDLLATVAENSYNVEDLSGYAERYKIRAYVSLGDLKFFGSFSDELPCYPYVNLTRKVTVDVDSTTMCVGAGPDHEVIKELARGTTGRVFAERTGSDGSRWFRVELNDGLTGWISREDVSIVNSCKTLTARTYTAENPIIIYLSPSKQDNNPYCIGDTNEREQMEAVAAVTHRILKEEYQCVVHTAKPELELRERAFEAMELKADVYLAFHSNATGTGDVHYGASSYYCGASGRSKRLGEQLNKKLNAIAPKQCTLYKQMNSALESFGGVGYAEVRDPYNLGMVAVLEETDFHDNELTARWIIDNHEAIGRAYAEALVETFDIPEK